MWRSAYKLNTSKEGIKTGFANNNYLILETTLLWREKTE